MGRPRPECVPLSTPESAFFLALATRDGVRLPGLEFEPFPAGTTATDVGAWIGMAPGEVLASCEGLDACGWYAYRDSGKGVADADSGRVTDTGKLAAIYMWCSGDAAGSN